MIVKVAEERSPIDIDIEDIISSGGKLNILSDVKNYFSLDYKPQNKSISFVAGGYIGLIPVNENVAIDIRPKFKISNLTRLVAIAEDNFRTLEFFNRSYEESRSQEPVVFKFLLQCLVKELRTLEVEGVLKEYLLYEENGSRISGRVNYPKTIRDFWARGSFHKASSNYYNMTANNPYNQLIKYTLDYSIGQLNKHQINDPSLRNSLAHAYLMFQSVELKANVFQLNDIVSELIAAEKITKLRHYYINVCELCRIITNQKGLSFESNSNGVALSSFILDMASIFERYLLNVLRKNKELFVDRVNILDGNAEGKKKFFNQPSVATGDAKPDFIINVDGETRLIADAKYKAKTKDIDRYQVISHALSYGAGIAVLISPTTDESATEKLIKIGTVGPTESITLYEYKFNLNANDLNVEEHGLVIALSGLV